MKLMAALDNKNGMMFNHRRQSQDALLRAHILELSKNSILWITPYTKKQFDVLPEYVRVTEHPMEQAGRGEYCFVEDVNPDDEGKIEELIIFRWNRTYPADETLGIELSKWKLKETFEFQGKSHEKITKEVYGK